MKKFDTTLLVLQGFRSRAQGPNFLSPSAVALALRHSPNCKLNELKILDFSDRTRTGISISTSATDWLFIKDKKLNTSICFLKKSLDSDR